jgi:hypothetical protein
MLYSLPVTQDLGDMIRKQKQYLPVYLQWLNIYFKFKMEAYKNMQ